VSTRGLRTPRLEAALPGSRGLPHPRLSDGRSQPCSFEIDDQLVARRQPLPLTDEWRITELQARRRAPGSCVHDDRDRCQGDHNCKASDRHLPALELFAALTPPNEPSDLPG
jgi:hypothetical protein